MCEPNTIAIASMVASGVGTVMQMSAQSQAASAQRAQANYQAQVADNNRITAERLAVDAEQRGEIEVRRHRQQVEQLKGRQVAALAASGVDVASGSPLDVLADTAGLGALDQQTIRDNAAREAWQHRVQAGNQQNQANLLRFQADNTASGAAGTLLTGIGGVADKWWRYRTLTAPGTAGSPATGTAGIGSGMASG